ncbi:CPBP family intramembrane glutamic endopeptidase [Thermohalobacter berrensis]|uniref:CAAX prenyl protease 2/Lysostaphin resistance protein A-like domain-containing protein n=1 Tax=Thermohalobacter berrensis TaxID=99594 RepID=A0A419SUS2_9FIRM|nr:CPBP family intramembrane glutamic endopeptidase [Thermohalobacter berrensis]RKD28970.1 hypothetical protein BET03_06350 [Thermohalobacter berrensis]
MGVLFFFKILLYLGIILILLKQYIVSWVLLDKVGYKFLKYIIPISEILLLLFFDGLFLLPSVLAFLFLIYKHEIYKDRAFKKYYSINKEKFFLKREKLTYVILISPVIFLTLNNMWESINNFLYKFNIELKISEYNFTFLQKDFVDYLVLFVLVCIIAPIVEEFTFRVLIYDNWFRKKYDKKIIALIASALLFSLSHFDINTLLFTFITGIVLGFIYDIFGYLGSAVFHMCMNFYTFMGVIGLSINKIFTLSIILILGFYLFINRKDSERVKT